MMRRNKTREIVIGLVMCLVLWTGLSLAVNNPVLPPPWEVFPVFLILMFGQLGLHFLASSLRLALALSLSIFLATPLGLLLGVFRPLDNLLSPLVNFLYPIPKIVLLPVFYILIGVSETSKIFLICLILFFQILVVVRDKALSLPPETVFSVRSLGSGRLGLLLFVYLPGCIPSILTALRVSIATALAVLFFAEQSLTEYGLGYFIMVKSYQVLRYKEMYAGIMAISLLGFLLYLVLDMADDALSPRFGRAGKVENKERSDNARL